MTSETLPDQRRRPRIVVTLSNPERARNPGVAEGKNGRYLDALRHHGASPLPLDDRAPAATRRRALVEADGLLITGGVDIDPVRYGEPARGSGPSDAARDALDEAADRAASARGIPILGICRGLQAINVFAGGALVQHVEHHESPAYPERAADATRHELRMLAGTRLARMLGTDRLEVNSFHHQAVDLPRLAPGLRVAGTTAHDGGEPLVEALESADPERWLFAVQCHPERIESSPPELAALWEAFVAAASGSPRDDGGGG